MSADDQGWARSTRLERILIVAAPAVAMLNVAIGLGLGAGGAARGATVFGAPPGDEGRRLALQVRTALDDRSVRSPSEEWVRVVGRQRGMQAAFQGGTNGQGVGEALLEFPGALDPDAPIDVRVEADPIGGKLPAGEGPVVLAQGTFRLRDLPRPEIGMAAPVRPAKREGKIGLDVFVPGGRLASGFVGEVWVRTTGAKGNGSPGREPSTRESNDVVASTGAKLQVEEEPGFEVHGHPSACPSGWFSVRGRPGALVSPLHLTATDDSGQTGEWFGAVPVAPGAPHAAVPVFAFDGPGRLHLESPNAGDIIYAEIATDRGRRVATVAQTTPGEGLRASAPSAVWNMPVLAPGSYFLVLSNSPRGAETVEGSTVALPFVAHENGANVLRCEDGPANARRAAVRFPRALVAEGWTMRGEERSKRRARGLAIALVSLFAAAALEALLLVRANRRTNQGLAQIDRAIGEHATVAGAGSTEPGAATGRGGDGLGANLALGLALAVLGFSLLAALLIKAG